MGIACCTCATGKWWMEAQSTDMSTIWRGFVRTIFWSYERGSWPYDIAVIVIVIFVLLSPTRWFHDQPQSKAVASGEVQLLVADAPANTATYRVDAAVLPIEKRQNHSTPELEGEMHRILGNTVQDLKDQPFEVVRIDPQMAAGGTVTAYDVSVRR
jgi:hypothetical protein